MESNMLKIKRSRMAAIMILALSLLSLYASVRGVIDKYLYTKVYEAGTMSQSLITGCIAQDIVIIPLSILSILVSVFFLIRTGYKAFIMLLGFAWCFFYGFGLYVIEANYTSIYLVYLAIFGLALYSMILGLLSFKPEGISRTRLPASLRVSISIYFLLTLAILIPGWLLRIAPDIARHMPCDTYAVYIMDLTMVFPAFGIIAVQLLRNQPLGNILSGVALFKGFTLCLSWAFAELSAPIFGKTIIPEMAVISGLLTVFGIILFIPYILKLKMEEHING